MANEKILNTRVQLKYDTLANWNASTFIPKKGEMCIATVDTAQKDAKGNIITVPTLLIKVGNNTEKFADLPFVSAPAADVYDWAKQSEADFVANFLKMEGMQAALDGVFATDEAMTTAIAGVQDEIKAVSDAVTQLSTYVGTIPEGYSETNVIAYINKKAQEVLEQASGGSSESAASVLAALNAYKAENDPKVTANTNAIAAIKDGTTIDSFADVETAVANALAEAKKYADDNDADTIYDDSEVKEDIAANAEAIAAEAERAAGAESALEARIGTLEGVDHAAAHAATLQSAKAYTDEAKTALQGNIDTLAQTHATDKAALEASIKENTDAIGVLNGNSSVDGSVDKKIADAINDFATKVSDDQTVNTYKELIDYAATHGSDFTELVGEVDANTAAIATLNGDASTAGSVDKKVADAVNPINTTIEVLQGTDTTLQSNIDTLAQTHATDKAALEQAIADEKSAREAADTAMETAYKAYADQAEADAVATAAADATSKASTAETNAKAYADGLDEATNGRIDALTTDDIAAGTEVWVFNCGSATENID